MPIQYEVSLAVNKEIVPMYLKWLKAHVIEMLSFPGFENAAILDQLDPVITEEHFSVIVQYRLKDTNTFETYLQTQAERMRKEGIERFGDKVSATRRLSYIKEELFSEPTPNQ